VKKGWGPPPTLATFVVDAAAAVLGAALAAAVLGAALAAAVLGAALCAADGDEPDEHAAAAITAVRARTVRRRVPAMVMTTVLLGSIPSCLTRAV